MTMVLFAALLFFPLSAQEERSAIEEVLKKHKESIEKMDGVIAVDIGGTGEDMRVLIRVNTKEAKSAVREKLGEALEGYKVFVYVAAKTGQTTASTRPAVPPPLPPRTETQPDPTIEDCDIVRDHLRLKPVTHHEGGKTIDGCQLIRRERIGSGGGRTFWFTKHRRDCPIRANRLKEPEDTDDFLKWVFRQGFQPAQRRSFLLFELKGSDKLWFEEVKQDLTEILPLIREGAHWVEIDKDKAGLGWKWEVPKPKEHRK